MIGAIEQPALGMVLVGDVAPLSLRSVSQQLFHVIALTAPDQHRVLNRAIPLQRVESQVRGHLIHREKWMLRIIFRAEKPPLFRRPRRKHERSLRPWAGGE